MLLFSEKGLLRLRFCLLNPATKWATFSPNCKCMLISGKTIAMTVNATECKLTGIFTIYTNKLGTQRI